MEIIILSIGNHRQVRNGKHNGVRIDFGSTAVNGAAVLIAESRDIKVGDKINVETEYESCDNFVSAPPSSTAFVQYNESANCYIVHAPVSLVHEDGAFFVQVEDFHLMLEPLKSFQIAKGDWLKFHLHGLSLWKYSI